jgi:hypothetical protein
LLALVTSLKARDDDILETVLPEFCLKHNQRKQQVYSSPNISPSSQMKARRSTSGSTTIPKCAPFTTNSEISVVFLKALDYEENVRLAHSIISQPLHPLIPVI